MKIARIAFEESTRYAIVDGEQYVCIQDDIFTAISPTKETCPLAQATILPPVMPSKIIALAVNFESHAKGHNMEAFPIPEPFFKTPSSILLLDLYLKFTFLIVAIFFLLSKKFISLFIIFIGIE